VGAQQLVVVPDGVLSIVPFAALPAAGVSFVAEIEPPIHYLSAERDLLLQIAPRPTPRGLLALGGPSYDDGPTRLSDAEGSTDAPTALGQTTTRRSMDSCASLQTLQFHPLDATQLEVGDLTRIWPARDDSTILLGTAASESGFKREAIRHRVLHLATHGFFLDGSCLTPPAANQQTRGVGGLARTTPVENPLRLSGLALAGANRRAQAKPDEDDGILTAEEVATLNLQGVEWAVLSACDTGVGEIKAGEGVFGLRRAFQVAGARTVIMSLWSVEDQATRAWMRALYEGRFQRNLSTADAVHQASLTVLRDRRARGLSTHPFYWAAFVAAGDWR
jgi:CHAT domain-containing protein